MLPAIVEQELDEQARLRAHRDAVHAIEDEMRKHEHWPWKLEHYFAHGVYGREMTLTKGSVTTGRIHKYSQINVILKGEIRVSTDKGVVHHRAPAVYVSPPGTKRLVFAVEETVWITFIGTNNTNLDAIVDDLTVETEEEYERHLALARDKPVEIEK